MALSNPRTIFGVHSFTPYSRTNGEFYGTLKVLGGSSFMLEGETVELFGGSAKYAWGVEEANVTAELTIKTKEYPNFLFELFLGKAPTKNAAETTGNVVAIANKYGTSAVAATGIATVAAKSGAAGSLKFGRYVVKVAAAATVNVYFSSDCDILRGVDGSFQDDTLKITATPLTITASTAVEIPNFGLELTGGAGTIGMTIGDTATFVVRPVNSESSTVIVGGTSDTFPEFGALLMSKQKGNGEMVEIDVYRCKGAGTGFPFEENAWSETEIKAKAFYDSVKGGVFEFRHVIPA